MTWLLENVAGFTDEDAVECATKCTKLGCNTIALLGEEFVIIKQEGSTVMDSFLNSLVVKAPLRRKLRHALEKSFCTSPADLPPRPTPATIEGGSDGIAEQHVSLTLC
ncbi:hypothetical protein EON65_33050 [archaeon]|nr:MAG: hypothetical protein EON65_33050 [archaeon]